MAFAIVCVLASSRGFSQPVGSSLAGESTAQNALGPHTPFGSVAFDPLPTSPNPSQYPPWNPVSCLQDLTSPPAIVADDPETWTPTVWNLKNNALLEQGTFTNSGLVFFYFLNKLGATARLYVGARGTGGSTTFTYGKGSSGAVNSMHYEIAGALAEQSFLQPYVSGLGLTPGSAPPSTATPRPLFAPITVADGTLVTGEIVVANLSGSTSFYVYADDCSPTACPSTTNTATGDGQKRGGFFTGAHFTVTHNYTPSAIQMVVFPGKISGAHLPIHVCRQ